MRLTSTNNVHSSNCGHLQVTIKQNPTNQVQSLLQEAQIGVYGGYE